VEDIFSFQGTGERVYSFCSQFHYTTKCMFGTIDKIPEISGLKKPIFRGYIADSNRDYSTGKMLCFPFVFCCSLHKKSRKRNFFKLLFGKKRIAVRVQYTQKQLSGIFGFPAV